MPFTREQFFELFGVYNSAVGLNLLVLYAAALAALTLLYRRNDKASRATFAVLAFFWLWMGIIYHWMYFTRINPAAWGFGAFFVAEGLLFGFAALRGWKIRLSPASTRRGVFQIACFVFALLIYPMIGFALGHGYPTGPAFGLPCPTTIFTFGLLSAVTESRKRIVAISVVPFMWAAIGTSAATLFGVYQDLALAAAALGLIAFIWANRRDVSATRPVPVGFALRR